MSDPMMRPVNETITPLQAAAAEEKAPPLLEPLPPARFVFIDGVGQSFPCATFDDAAKHANRNAEGRMYVLVDGEPADDKAQATYPAGVTPTVCRYCGQKVLWIETVKAGGEPGGKLCVDVVGPVYVIAQAGVRPADLVGVNANLPHMRDRLRPLISKPLVGVYVSHFRTCRKVEEVKRDQAKKKGGK